MTAPRFLSSLPLQFLSPAALDPCTVALPDGWPLTHGGQLTGGQVAFELTGPADAPVVAVLGGISAGRHVTATAENPDPGWWRKVVGPGRAIDTDCWRVLSLDFLGGNGASSGPRCCPPGFAPEGFPAIATLDQAHALALVLDALEIPRLRALVGASYGGMVGLCFAIRYPQRLERLVAISAAHRSHPQATAWRSLQRQIVRLGLRREAAHESLALSRALAMLTYRSPEELAARFDGRPRRGPAGFRFPIDDYLEARGTDFAERFDPHAFLRLSESIDLHRIDPRRVATPTVLVGVRSDQLVPIADVRTLAADLGASCRLAEIDSLYGHDAFLKEVAVISEIVTTTLAEGRV